jgi:hypothetical protein
MEGPGDDDGLVTQPKCEFDLAGANLTEPTT